MTSYGTHTYTTDVQGILTLSATVSDDIQWEVSITVNCTAPAQPAQLYGPPEDCYPAEGPEFELTDLCVVAGKIVIVSTQDWRVGEALFGETMWLHLYYDAVTDAKENMDDDQD